MISDNKKYKFFILKYNSVQNQVFKKNFKNSSNCQSQISHYKKNFLKFQKDMGQVLFITPLSKIKFLKKI